MHVTIDTQIVMICNDMSNITKTPDHDKLKGFFDSEIFLAMDREDQIKTEYERKMGAESGRKWLANLAVQDRIRMFDLAKLPTKARVELDKEHFHQSDRKFVRLAMSAESKRLVAEESDYSKAVCKVLKKHAGVIVHSASQACDLIAAVREPAPPDAKDE
jgi:hypothetical protein